MIASAWRAFRFERLKVEREMKVRRAKIDMPFYGPQDAKDMQSKRRELLPSSAFHLL
jgi:hypothetical protein